MKTGPDGVSIRRATLEDSPTLLRWRNDPTTYRHFETPHQVTGDEHAAWFENVINDPARLILIGVVDDEPAGTVRFDRFAEDDWIVSITVSPPLRGRGLAESLLRSGIAALRSSQPTASALVARIAPENTASRRLFERCGFELIEDPEVGVDFATWTLSLRPSST